MRIEQGWQPSEIERLVDIENATASRLIFTDETLFRLELQRIFARTWLYIGHESEIPNKGDYVTRKMGNDPVILVRDQEHDGTRVLRLGRGSLSAQLAEPVLSISAAAQ